MVILATFTVLVGFGLIWLVASRIDAACKSGLSILEGAVRASEGEITHLRAQLRYLQDYIMAIKDPTAQARIVTQQSPSKPYDPGWEVYGRRPRNPTEVPLPGTSSDDGTLSILGIGGRLVDTVPRTERK